MSAGFAVYSAAGHASISSLSYNMVYAGRGALYLSGHSSGNSSEDWKFSVTSPRLSWYDFYIDIVDSAAVVPFFSCTGYCGLSFIRRSSTVANRWEMEFFATAQPVVYCFTRLPVNTPVSGDGIAVYNENGGVSYLSTKPHIVMKAVQTSYSSACNPEQRGGTNGLAAPDQTVTYTELGLGWLPTPIMHFACPNSGAGGSGGGYQYFFPLVAELSGSGVNTRWGTGAVFYRYPTLYANWQESVVVMVADGSAFQG
jgi:hypothetical protein